MICSRPSNHHFQYNLSVAILPATSCIRAISKARDGEIPPPPPRTKNFQHGGNAASPDDIVSDVKCRMVLDSLQLVLASFRWESQTVALYSTMELTCAK